MPAIYYPCSPGEILQGVFDRIASIEGFKLVDLNRILPVKAEEADQVPYALIYNNGDTMERIGEPNCGNPWFKHTLHIVIDVVLKELDQTDTFLDSTAVGEIVQKRLLNDPSFYTLIEGVGNCSREIFLPGETDQYLIGVKLNIEVTFESEWQVDLPNDLDAIQLSILRRSSDRDEDDNPVFREIILHERNRLPDEGQCTPD